MSSLSGFLAALLLCFARPCAGGDQSALRVVVGSSACPQTVCAGVAGQPLPISADLRSFASAAGDADVVLAFAVSINSPLMAAGSVPPLRGVASPLTLVGTGSHLPLLQVGVEMRLGNLAGGVLIGARELVAREAAALAVILPASYSGYARLSFTAVELKGEAAAAARAFQSSSSAPDDAFVSLVWAHVADAPKDAANQSLHLILRIAPPPKQRPQLIAAVAVAPWTLQEHETAAPVPRLDALAPSVDADASAVLLLAVAVTSVGANSSGSGSTLSISNPSAAIPGVWVWQLPGALPPSASGWSLGVNESSAASVAIANTSLFGGVPIPPAPQWLVAVGTSAALSGLWTRLSISAPPISQGLLHPHSGGGLIVLLQEYVPSTSGSSRLTTPWASLALPFHVAPVNDPPLIMLPPATSAVVTLNRNKSAGVALFGADTVRIQDPDIDPAGMALVTLSVSVGTLELPRLNELRETVHVTNTQNHSSDRSRISLEGSLSALNAVLSLIFYKPDTPAYGVPLPPSDTLTVTVTDSYAGGMLPPSSSTASSVIHLEPGPLTPMLRVLASSMPSQSGVTLVEGGGTLPLLRTTSRREGGGGGAARLAALISAPSMSINMSGSPLPPTLPFTLVAPQGKSIHLGASLTLSSIAPITSTGGVIPEHIPELHSTLQVQAVVRAALGSTVEVQRVSVLVDPRPVIQTVSLCARMPPRVFSTFDASAADPEVVLGGILPSSNASFLQIATPVGPSWSLMWDLSAFASSGKYGVSATKGTRFMTAGLSPRAVGRTAQEAPALTFHQNPGYDAASGLGGSMQSRVQATGLLAAFHGATSAGSPAHPTLDVYRSQLRLTPAADGSTCVGYSWELRFKDVPHDFPLPTVDASHLLATWPGGLGLNISLAIEASVIHGRALSAGDPSHARGNEPFAYSVSYPGSASADAPPGPPQPFFALWMEGVSTPPIPLNASTAQVLHALQALTSIDPESVAISREYGPWGDVTGGAAWLVSFLSCAATGTFPLLQPAPVSSDKTPLPFSFSPSAPSASSSSSLSSTLLASDDSVTVIVTGVTRGVGSSPAAWAVDLVPGLSPTLTPTVMQLALIIPRNTGSDCKWLPTINASAITSALDPGNAPEGAMELQEIMDGISGLSCRPVINPAASTAQQVQSGLSSFFKTVSSQLQPGPLRDAFAAVRVTVSLLPLSSVQAVAPSDAASQAALTAANAAIMPAQYAASAAALDPAMRAIVAAVPSESYGGVWSVTLQGAHPALIPTGLKTMATVSLIPHTAAALIVANAPAPLGGSFRLGLGGNWTKSLPVNASAMMVANALSELPVIVAATAMWTVNGTSDAPVLVVRSTRTSASGGVSFSIVLQCGHPSLTTPSSLTVDSTALTPPHTFTAPVRSLPFLPSWRRQSSASPFALSLDDSNALSTRFALSIAYTAPPVTQPTVTLNVAPSMSTTPTDLPASTAMELRLVGSWSDVLSALASVTFRPHSSWSGRAIVTVELSLLVAPPEVTSAITGIQDIPSPSTAFALRLLTTPAPPSPTISITPGLSSTAPLDTNEDVPLPLSAFGLRVDDAVMGARGSITVTLSSHRAGGRVTLAGTVVPNVSTTFSFPPLVLSGSIDVVNARLRTVVYTPPQWFSGSDVITVTAQASGSFPPVMAPRRILRVNVIPVNNAPLVSMSLTSINATAGVETPLAPAHIRVWDEDMVDHSHTGNAYMSRMSVTLAVISAPPSYEWAPLPNVTLGEGLLRLTRSEGVELSTGRTLMTSSITGSTAWVPNVTLSGSLAAVNLALESLHILPSPRSSGKPLMLSITANDGGWLSPHGTTPPTPLTAVAHLTIHTLPPPVILSAIIDNKHLEGATKQASASLPLLDPRNPLLVTLEDVTMSVPGLTITATTSWDMQHAGDTGVEWGGPNPFAWQGAPLPNDTVCAVGVSVTHGSLQILGMSARALTVFASSPTLTNGTASINVLASRFALVGPLPLINAALRLVTFKPSRNWNSLHSAHESLLGAWEDDPLGYDTLTLTALGSATDASTLAAAASDFVDGDNAAAASPTSIWQQQQRQQLGAASILHVPVLVLPANDGPVVLTHAQIDYNSSGRTVDAMRGASHGLPLLLHPIAHHGDGFGTPVIVGWAAPLPAIEDVPLALGAVLGLDLRDVDAEESAIMSSVGLLMSTCPPPAPPSLVFIVNGTQQREGSPPSWWCSALTSAAQSPPPSAADADFFLRLNISAAQGTVSVALQFVRSVLASGGNLSCVTHPQEYEGPAPVCSADTVARGVRSFSLLGPLLLLRKAAASLVFTGARDFSGVDDVTITLGDEGNAGLLLSTLMSSPSSTSPLHLATLASRGGVSGEAALATLVRSLRSHPLSDTLVVPIRVAAVPDAPRLRFGYSSQPPLESGDVVGPVYVAEGGELGLGPLSARARRNNNNSGEVAVINGIGPWLIEDADVSLDEIAHPCNTTSRLLLTLTVAHGTVTIAEDEGTMTPHETCLWSDLIDITSTQGGSRVTAQGPAWAVQHALLRLSYVAPIGAWNSLAAGDLDILDVSVSGSDNGAEPLTTTVSLHVYIVPMNNAPVIGLPGATLAYLEAGRSIITSVTPFHVAEDTPIALMGITLTDVDAEESIGTLTLTLSASHGNLSVSQPTIGFKSTSTVEDAWSVLTLEGRLPELQYVLLKGDIIFAPEKDYYGPAEIQIFASDGGATDALHADGALVLPPGSPLAPSLRARATAPDMGIAGALVGVQTDNVTLPLSILPVNDAPRWVIAPSVAKSLELLEGGSAAVEGIQLVDVDMPPRALLRVGLRADVGLLSLDVTPGLFVQPNVFTSTADVWSATAPPPSDATDAPSALSAQSALTLWGTLPVINAALSRLTYTSPPQWNSDGGNRRLDAITLAACDGMLAIAPTWPWQPSPLQPHAPLPAVSIKRVPVTRVVGVNDAPVLHYAGAVSVVGPPCSASAATPPTQRCGTVLQVKPLQCVEDTPCTLPALSVTDVDVTDTPGAVLEITLACRYGRVQISPTISGLRWMAAGAPSAANPARVAVIRCVPSSCSAALASLMYIPPPNWWGGEETLSILANDLASTGVDGTVGLTALEIPIHVTGTDDDLVVNVPLAPLIIPEDGVLGPLNASITDVDAHEMMGGGSVSIFSVSVFAVNGVIGMPFLKGNLSLLSSATLAKLLLEDAADTPDTSSADANAVTRVLADLEAVLATLNASPPVWDDIAATAARSSDVATETAFQPFLHLRGTLSAVNAALSLAVFLPEPNFHGGGAIIIRVVKLLEGLTSPLPTLGVVHIRVMPIFDAPVLTYHSTASLLCLPSGGSPVPSCTPPFHTDGVHLRVNATAMLSSPTLLDEDAGPTPLPGVAIADVDGADRYVLHVTAEGGWVSLRPADVINGTRSIVLAAITAAASANDATSPLHCASGSVCSSIGGAVPLYALSPSGWDETLSITCDLSTCNALLAQLSYIPSPRTCGPAKNMHHGVTITISKDVSISLSSDSLGGDALLLPLTVQCRNAAPIILGPATDAIVSLREGDTITLGGLLRTVSGVSSVPASFMLSDPDGLAAVDSSLAAPYALTVAATKGVVTLATNASDADALRRFFGSAPIPQWHFVNTSTFTVTGTFDALAILLRRVAFTGAPGANGPAHVILTIADLTSEVSFAASSYTISLYLIPVNQPPTLAISSLTGAGKTPIPWLGDPIIVSESAETLLRVLAGDPDAAEDALPGPYGLLTQPSLAFEVAVSTVSLSASPCVQASLSSLSGISFTHDSTNTGRMSFFATLAHANGALKQLRLHCIAPHVVNVTTPPPIAGVLELKVDDGGRSGEGGALSVMLRVPLLVSCTACTE